VCSNKNGPVALFLRKVKVRRKASSDILRPGGSSGLHVVSPRPRNEGWNAGLFRADPTDEKSEWKSGGREGGGGGWSIHVLSARQPSMRGGRGKVRRRTREATEATSRNDQSPPSDPQAAKGMTPRPLTLANCQQESGGDSRGHKTTRILAMRKNCSDHAKNRLSGRGNGLSPTN